MHDINGILHAADIEQLERRIMELALERTGARHGALFLWDARRKGLAPGFHVVEGLVVNVPGALLRPRRDGRPNGIALWVFEANEAALVPDTSHDPRYARYFLDVRSIAAVPIRYQRGAIGVLSVSAREPGAFGPEHLAELEALAGSSAKFLRRAQLARAGRRETGRPFLIKGLSPEWLEVERRIERVAGTGAPVLIEGESGTGKELVAHAIHFNSRRAARPFVVVNCAAIPDTLLESTLFGHVKGAFTGAAIARLGEFRRADGGTLFLDELGELPLTLQPKLLRALESGDVQPLGSDEPQHVDVRLVCATNRDLADMVRRRLFRDDLYYRVGVTRLELPPLRRYKEGNLEVLAHVFAQESAGRHGRALPRFSPEALALLQAYDYPGNVRELRNAVEHAVILADGDELGPEHLPASIAGPHEPAPPAAPLQRPAMLAELRERWLAVPEKRWLEELLARTGGRVREAARQAGIDPVTMYRLLRKRGVPHGRAAH